MPLLRRIRELDPPTFESIMGDNFLGALDEDGEFRRFIANDVLDDHGAVRSEWVDRFTLLYNTNAAQLVFAEASEPFIDSAATLCEKAGFITERGFALCFDVAVQNGAPREDHLRAFGDTKKDGRWSTSPEWKKLKRFAHIVADLANPRWRDDVLARKLTIAVGAGVVHGKRYDPEEQFGIDYDRIWYDHKLPCGIKRIFLNGEELRVDRASLVENKLYVRTRK